MKNQVVSLLKEISIAVAKDMWRLLDKKVKELPPIVPRLIIPGLRSGNARISEQESKIVFCSVMEKTYGYFYSIETPTEEEYRFTGEKTLSARSDLSIWKFNG
jgi:hypothetical protein